MSRPNREGSPLVVLFHHPPPHIISMHGFCWLHLQNRVSMGLLLATLSPGLSPCDSHLSKFMGPWPCSRHGHLPPRHPVPLAARGILFFSLYSAQNIVSHFNHLRGYSSRVLTLLWKPAPPSRHRALVVPVPHCPPPAPSCGHPLLHFLSMNLTTLGTSY